MSDAFATMDRTAFDGFRNGDERSLEQVIRHGFPTLAAVAAADAADDVAAARVIEGAFIEAWGERATLQTPESLETFLRQAVHRGAVRERSRKAALHRFEAHEGVKPVNALPRTAAGAPITADEIWSRVNTVLHTPRPTTESTQRIRADVSRHEAASHVAKIAKRDAQGSSMALMAVVAVVVLGAIAALAWFLQPSGVSDARLDSAIAAQDARVRNTEAGQRASVELLDGTKVMLGAATKLRIPREFGEQMRGVGLEGTASFTVTPNAENTFVVRAGGASVRVTGTAFDVSAFPNDAVVVRVREGTVTVAAGEKSRALEAGDAVAVDADGTMRDPAAPVVEQAVGWADDQFVVVDRPLREVVPLLNRWYRLDLNVAEESLLDRKATVRAPIGSSRQAIEAVEKSANVKFGYEGEAKVLRDAAKAPK